MRVAYYSLSLVSGLMLLAELLAGYEFQNNAGLWSGPILGYMVLVTFSGLFSLRIGSHYALEQR